MLFVCVLFRLIGIVLVECVRFYSISVLVLCISCVMVGMLCM